MRKYVLSRYKYISPTQVKVLKRLRKTGKKGPKSHGPFVATISIDGHMYDIYTTNYGLKVTNGRDNFMIQTDVALDILLKNAKVITWIVDDHHYQP